MMKKAEIKMSLLMGGTISFINSLIGILSSGRFTVGGFLKNWLLSFLISFVLGLVVPIRKISSSLIRKKGLKPGTLKARLLEALVSDLVYSPVMTFVMVYLAYRQAVAHGAKISFLPMLLRSECIAFVSAFILSFLLAPVYSRLAFRNMER